MSRIGKLPIPIPQGVEVSLLANNEVRVKGPKGELHLQVNPDITIEINDGKVVVKRPSDQKHHKALHGLYRSLIANMVKGVSVGFTKKLQVVGVGYRAEAKGQQLELSLGFSHDVTMILPPEVKVSVDAGKGKDTIITLESHDKELLGQVAARIRALRKPEPYKGKGIRYVGEYVRRKAGKAAGK